MGRRKARVFPLPVGAWRSADKIRVQSGDGGYLDGRGFESGVGEGGGGCGGEGGDSGEARHESSSVGGDWCDRGGFGGGVRYGGGLRSGSGVRGSGDDNLVRWRRRSALRFDFFLLFVLLDNRGGSKVMVRQMLHQIRLPSLRVQT